MRAAGDILQEYGISADKGHSSDTVSVSRQKHGRNSLTPLPREPIWKKFLEKFDEPIIKILLAAALLSIVVDLFKGSVWLGAAALIVVIVTIAAGFAVAFLRNWVPSLLFALALFWVIVSAVSGHPSYEGLAVMVAVVLATGVAFISEYRSDREFEVLNARKDEIHVKLTRNGEFQTIPLEEVVVGDVVTLEMGDEVPADGRLLKATELYVDQSLMTGESEPVHKQARPISDTSDGPEQAGCMYRGTQVVDGIGQLLVADVGDATMIGQIARRLSLEEGDDDEAGATSETEEVRVRKKLTISKHLTPLQEKLTRLADLISKVGYVAAGLILIEMLVFGAFDGKFTQDFATAIRYLLGAFIYTVIVIVVAVPEGLPMSVTVSLALAMRKMTRANSLVRQLVACETIGSATVICSDKTGTLTQNRMQVVRTWFGGRTGDRGTATWSTVDASTPWPRAGKPIDWLTLISCVNSTANLEEKDGGKLDPIGNTTEGALLQWAHENGIVYQNLRLQFEPLYQIHFSSERKRMTSVIRYGDSIAAMVKGAPEWVLEQSTQYLDSDGVVRDWTPEVRRQLQDALKDAAGQAMRTLAFGYALLPQGTPVDEDTLHARRDELENGLVFVGFVAIRDPLREDVKDAVADCRQAGIEVKMITGDNVETARAIAKDIGLLDIPDALVLTSQEFNALSDGQVKESLSRLRVLARAKPLDKFQMVKLLQDQNHVVAMTGDGTNDAPSLKKADVGLAMGIAGTEVAKEASKIVLLDDAFSTIVKAVHWGRSLYENIQRFIQFQLTINVSALTIAFLGPFLNIRPPFTVLQLLWINVIMDTFASIALCSEPPRAGLMKMPPKRKDESILSKSMISTILTTSVFFVVVMILLLYGMQHWGWFKGDGANSEVFGSLSLRQVSIFFTVYVFFQIWNQINCRSLTPEVSGLKGLFRNPSFMFIASLTLLGQILIITVGGKVFEVERLGIVEWVVIAASTASVLVFSEVVRIIRQSMAKQK